VLVLKAAQSGRPTALRLSGLAPQVPSFFAHKSVPEAWAEFIASMRRAAGLAPGQPWSEFNSQDELTHSWSLTT
jgi:hypothetical protein